MRNNFKWYVYGSVLLLATLLVLRFTIFAPKPDDQKLIAEALRQSIQASKEGRPGGVLEILSNKFKINQQSPGRFDIAKFVRENKPDVEVSNSHAIVSGDTARIDTPVRVKVSFLNQNFDQTIDNVTLVFQKEDTYRYVVFPTRQWRLTDVEVPANAVPVNFGESSYGGFGGFGF
ncbi:MAG: hypothetical protein QOJ65_1551 [Fimbriimonadaceae bacterium]|jgi:hypothetical protein|nr:hypothetical protein [Fimbriimonadaceae bacterium]